MKKVIIIIIIGAILIFVGYKSCEILNNRRIENVKGEKFLKSDLIGEIESISGSDIILKVMNIPDNKYGDLNKSGPQIEYTGEKKNITISSNIKIFKNSISENGFNQKEIDISYLKIGDVLNITYKEDKSTIDKIILDEMRNNKKYNIN